MKVKIIILICCVGIAAGCSGPHFYLLQGEPKHPIAITSVDFAREISDKDWKSLVDVGTDGSGNSYILDASTHQVAIYDSRGKRLLNIGETGFFKKTFPRPSGIAVDKERRVFVSDTKRDNVQSFDRSGAFMLAFGEKGSETGSFRDPLGLDADNQGSIYVADPGNERIQKFNTNGTFVMQILSGPKDISNINASRARGPIKFTAPPKFYRVTDVTVGLNGMIYVLDEGNCILHTYDQTGTYLFSFGGRSRRSGKFKRPSGIAVGALGLVCVADELKNNIQLFTPTGRFITGLGSKGKKRGQFRNPSGIAADSHGRIFVADRGNRRIQIFSCSIPQLEPVATLDKAVRIAVFDFKNNNPVAESRGYGQSISEMFITAFANSPNFEVVERKQLKGVLDEIYLDQSGIVETETAKKVGKILGIDVALAGGVAALANSIQIDLRLLDVETGKVVIADSIEAGSEGQLRGLVNQEVTKLENSYALRYGPPSPPGGLKVDAGVKSCILSWKENREPDIKEYRVYRAAAADGPYELVAKTKKTEWTDKGLPYDATYYYRLTAIDNGSLESKESPSLKVKTLSKPGLGRLAVKAGREVKSSSFSWVEKETNVSEYVIHRSSSKEGPFEIIGKSHSPKFSETDLGDGETYYYKVVKKYSDGLESAPSKPFAISTEAAPVVPEGLKVESGLPRRVKLKWSKPKERDIKEFLIYRSRQKDDDYKKIASVRHNRLSKQIYVDKGLKDNTTYYYKIQAVDNYNLSSPLSAHVEAKTKVAPSVPRRLVATGNKARSIPLKWHNNPEKDIKSYVIFSSDSEGGEFRRVGTTGKNNFVHQNLKDKTAYYYKISAVDRDGLVSDLSDPVSAITKPRPVKPSGLESESGLVKSARLKWAKNPETDIDYYIIRRKPAKSGRYRDVGKSKTNIYLDTGLADGSIYRYVVKAVCVEGLVSDTSEQTDVETKPRPSPPEDLEVEAKPDRVVLKWDANPENDIAGYEIFRKEGWNIFSKEKRIGQVTGLSFEDCTAKAGKEYHYMVTAFDKAGLHSDKSRKASIKIPTQ